MSRQASEADSDDNPATGIHQVAVAVINSSVATRAELDLAGVVLRKSFGRDVPRELEGELQAFNRVMDAAIDAANKSAGRSRGDRRSGMALALDRADLVLLDRARLVDLLLSAGE